MLNFETGRELEACGPRFLGVLASWIRSQDFANGTRNSEADALCDC